MKVFDLIFVKVAPGFRLVTSNLSNISTERLRKLGQTLMEKLPAPNLLAAGKVTVSSSSHPLQPRGHAEMGFPRALASRRISDRDHTGRRFAFRASHPLQPRGQAEKEHLNYTQWQTQCRLPHWETALDQSLHPPCTDQWAFRTLSSFCPLLAGELGLSSRDCAYAWAWCRHRCQQHQGSE